MQAKIKAKEMKAESGNKVKQQKLKSVAAQKKLALKKESKLKLLKAHIKAVAAAKKEKSSEDGSSQNASEIQGGNAKGESHEETRLEKGGSCEKGSPCCDERQEEDIDYERACSQKEDSVKGSSTEAVEGKRT